MSPTSSIAGHFKTGRAEDDRWRTLWTFLDTGKGDGEFPVARARLRNTFVFTPMRHMYNTQFHLPYAAAVAWKDGWPPRYVVDTVCGRRVTWFATSMDAPDGFEMCDGCALVDYLRPAVYRFFDADDRLLYVGYSRTVLQLFKQHSRARESQRWWVHQKRVEITWFATEFQGVAAEKAAILAEAPIYNRNNVPKKKWVAA